MRILKNDNGYSIGKDIQGLKDFNEAQKIFNAETVKVMNAHRLGGICYGIAGLIACWVINNIEKRLEKVESRFVDLEE